MTLFEHYRQKLAAVDTTMQPPITPAVTMPTPVNITPKPTTSFSQGIGAGVVNNDASTSSGVQPIQPASAIGKTAFEQEFMKCAKILDMTEEVALLELSKLA